MERPIGRQPGRVSKLTAEIQQEVKDWISKQVDLTLAELQLRIQEQHKVTVSLSRLWSLLKNLDLRLKKSRSTPVSKTLKPSIFSAENGGKTAKQSMRRT